MKKDRERYAEEDRRMGKEGRDRWWKKIEGRREGGKMQGWRRRTSDRIRGGMINGRSAVEMEGGVHLNVCMDFFVLTEYLVMSCLS